MHDTWSLTANEHEVGEETFFISLSAVSHLRACGVGYLLCYNYSDPSQSARDAQSSYKLLQCVRKCVDKGDTQYIYGLGAASCVAHEASPFAESQTCVSRFTLVRAL